MVFVVIVLGGSGDGWCGSSSSSANVKSGGKYS